MNTGKATLYFLPFLVLPVASGFALRGRRPYADTFCSTLRRKPIQRAYIARADNNISGTIMKNVLKLPGKSEGDIADGLSRYVKNPPAEFIAEAFSEYMDSPMPRRVAHVVKKQVDEYFKEFRIDIRRIMLIENIGNLLWGYY